MVYDEWLYSKSHVITSASTLTAYQTKLTVYYGSGTDSGSSVYLNSHCNADFSDIRFTNASDAALPYWIESKTDGVSAVVWVKVDSITTSTTIYLYYGNSSATSESNGNDVFVFFDDFAGTSLNTSKWNPTLIAYNGGIGTVIVNNTLTITNTNSVTGVGLSSLTALGSDSAYRIRTKVNSRNTGSTSTAQSRIVLTSTAADPGIFGLYNNSSEGKAYLHQGFGIGNPYILETFITSTPTIYDYECKVVNPKLYKNDSLVITGTGTPAAPPGTYIRIWSYSTSTSVTIDWICARAYASTEPTHSAWGTEIYTGPLSISIIPTTGTDPLDVTYNVFIPTSEPLYNFNLNYGDGTAYTEPPSNLISAITEPTIATGSSQYTCRLVVPSNKITSSSVCKFIRIKVIGGPFSHVSIVQRSSGADGTTIPTEITFNGTSGKTGDGEEWSDWIHYSVDPANSYLITFDLLYGGARYYNHNDIGYGYYAIFGPGQWNNQIFTYSIYYANVGYSIFLLDAEYKDSATSFSTTHTYDHPATYTVYADGYTEFATHKYYEIPYGVTVNSESLTSSFTYYEVTS